MAAQEIRIRQAVGSEGCEIAWVHIDSWRATYAGIVSAEYLAGLDYDRREAHWHRVPESVLAQLQERDYTAKYRGRGRADPPGRRRVRRATRNITAFEVAEA